ncbi:S8 family serine peptidase [Nocardioides sp. CFH 31398]|uniref:S8 family serine peptidase n=1 Tax=Nocardioides sp. CFH 31398 TaxID=2919579 RepID=UPI001F065915|nr:S8 family serine peptidase [Nocardioides sp. CFH 31398]MCH1866823.1 S8 family serine peptidase [Nocardioides sp. CFH 31398]
MRRSVRTATLAVASATALATVSAGQLAAQAAPAPSVAAERAPLAEVQDFLAGELRGLTGAEKVTVMVHGTDLAAAQDAVEATGMRTATTFDAIGVVVARGTAEQVAQARTEPGVTYLEGNQPIELTQETSNVATRGLEATRTLTGADGTPLTGRGVSVGVIDSGVDPNHPYLRDADGTKAVVSNQKVVCDPFEAACQVLDVGTSVDTDTLSVGGHGTHVTGIAAGRPTTLGDGGELQGAAPGAKVVSLSTGAALVIVGADAALNWVLENHEAPCGPGVSAAACPPIKVTNNSYGPSGGGEFDPESATVKLQRALAAEGVVTVWAAGNDGGDGSTSLTNPPGQDPTGGILSVASYNDLETGTRDGELSEFSSRGRDGEVGTYPDVSAPGDTITSSCRPYLVICSTGADPRNGPGALDVGTFNTISGTSMAAPHVAGIVAQLFQDTPDATPAEIERAITSTAHQYDFGAPYEAGGTGGTTSFDKGAGLVDVVAAANALG